MRVIDLLADDLVRERISSAGDDTHFPEALVRTVVEEFSVVGDVVLDPFAGFGTTLVVSARLGRQAIGIELLPERAALIRDRAGQAATVIEGDARLIDGMAVGPVDLCFTSPPYMSEVGHPENPLTAYQTLDGDYDAYLAELTSVFAGIARHLRAGGYLVINAANIRTADTVTTLAWDIARSVRNHRRFLGEIYLRWDRPPTGFTGDYCLVFRKESRLSRTVAGRLETREI